MRYDSPEYEIKEKLCPEWTDSFEDHDIDSLGLTDGNQ